MLTGLGAIDTELLQAQLQHDYNHSDTHDNDQCVDSGDGLFDKDSDLTSQQSIANGNDDNDVTVIDRADMTVVGEEAEHVSTINKSI